MCLCVYEYTWLNSRWNYGRKTRGSSSCPVQSSKDDTNGIIETEGNSNPGTSISIFRSLRQEPLSLCCSKAEANTKNLWKSQDFWAKFLYTFPPPCHPSSTLYRVSLRVSRHQVLDLVIMLRIAVSGQEKSSNRPTVNKYTHLSVIKLSICLIISFFNWHFDPWKTKGGVSSVLYPRPQSRMAFILCPLSPFGDNCLHSGAYITYVSTCSPNINCLGLK